MIYWIWLNSIKNLGPKKAKKLLDAFESPYEIYRADKGDLMMIDGIGNFVAENIVKSRDIESSKRIEQSLDHENVKILKYSDEKYPSLAKQSKNAPIVLFYRGSIRNMDHAISIVGSRNCSEYGRSVAKSLGRLCGEEDIPLISGMARGIDSYAQSACLKSNGYTIAFLGYGMDYCYPKEHRGLMDDIEASGAIISRYLPATSPRKAYFSQRNELIASWAKKTIVVEASENSGALITAHHARQLNREVLVIPHEIGKREGVGSNKLILDGARILLSKSQIIEKFLSKELGENEILGSKTNFAPKKELSPIENKILSILSKKPLTFEELLTKLDMSTSDLNQTLSILDIYGYLSRNSRTNCWEVDREGK